jgi:hypothetical protein
MRAGDGEYPAGQPSGFLQQVGDAEGNENCPWDQGSSQRPTRGEFGHDSNSSRRDKHATPEQNDDDYGVVDVIGGQARIDDVGERSGDVSRHTFAHPVVDAPCQPDANSAATKETGTRNTKAGTTYKNTEARPKTDVAGADPR